MWLHRLLRIGSRFARANSRAGLLLVLGLSLGAPTLSSGTIWRSSEAEKWRGRVEGAISARRAVEPQPLDVEHYVLQITLFPEARRIQGRVTLRGRTTASVESLRVDLLTALTVTRVLWEGAPIAFTHADDRVRVPIPLARGQTFTLTIEYVGRPALLGRLPSGMFFSEHAGFPVVATLSQPNGAPAWWPCVDDPADKATADIEVTVPPGYLVASNGLLEDVRLHPDGWRTYVWRERYPIATYLISIAATNFVQFSDVYRARDGTMMPLVYYVYPEHLDRARRAFPITREALRVFAELFGEYPFLAEKYGMAEFPWSGAMEHQTMTSIGSSVLTHVDTIVHEAAHQWWGNMVTPRTWHDIWLSEGFATYSEVLFREHMYGADPGQLLRQRDDGLAAGRLRGTVYAEDATDPFDDIPAIYTKGAWVLHMLRYLLGDDRFFAALREYGRRFAYANASTNDLERVFSEFYGESLEWFFEQWVYTPMRPIYAFSWSVHPESESYQLRLRLQQRQTHLIARRNPTLPPIYIMPVEFTLYYADGTSEVKRVWNRAREEEFTFALKRPPVRVTFDERGWILKEMRASLAGPAAVRTPSWRRVR
ncbi:MAG: M1 family metallopeptidase [Blastocatellia bacterium]|nr:M1 family metallopeptidase [Blastocatellia bacterium]MCS7156643.1 M1 family metallopeptidase [Blastocatellia bacterium]MCX7751615.1 M1 family metallopeptidase [Blastocatellia bacterium]MDW8168715.1 M1 family metallopeptidase [Acidobacteriota bacterium]MDW8256981.1 M1 family metallopeptidase [Acidobacteriota bacterium]